MKTRIGAVAGVAAAGLLMAISGSASAGSDDYQPGREVAISRHLQDGEEYRIPLRVLLHHGRKLFEANWTDQEGGGRPLTKGTGAPLADSGEPLRFPRNFNRVSAPDANSCAGCHNAPFVGGGGDIVANVFVLGQRFDHLTFDALGDTLPTKESVDERGDLVTLQSAANSRATIGMFGSGYIEMLARQITADLQQVRDALSPGESAPLRSKGIEFGWLHRDSDGSFDVSEVEGLPAPSLAGDVPSLLIRPFHQAGAVISLRQFTNNAFNHHHGIQTTERFGTGTDPDGDGFVDEMTRADVTAASLFQATLPVPGRVIPRVPQVERAVLRGETLFSEIGCASCHMPALPLDGEGARFVEPNPYNAAGDLQPGDAAPLAVDLNDRQLPGPRLRPDRQGITWVPAFTDFKLHDITSGPGDPNREPLNMHYAPGTDAFFAGNSRFLTKRLWGAANEMPFFHHGQYTTMREAILAHAGEARAVTAAFRALSEYDRGSIIEFLRTLQVLPPDARSLIVDERGNPRHWPTADYQAVPADHVRRRGRAHD